MPSPIFGRAPLIGTTTEALVYQLRDRDGGLLLLSHEAPDAPMARLKTGFSNSLNWRVYTEVDPRSGLWIHVADRQHHRMEGLPGIPW